MRNALLIKLLCWCVLCQYHTASATQAESQKKEIVHILVTASELPPYSSELIEGGGLMFNALNKYLKTHYPTDNFNLSPYIVPTARSQFLMESNNWCVSMHTLADMENYPYFLLDMPPMVLGLYRRAQSTPFEWQNLDQLSGKTIGALRVSKKQYAMQLLYRAGAKIVEVESLLQSYRLTMKGRTDFSLGDDKSYNFYRQAGLLDGVDLQFSSTKLGEFPFLVWVNPECKEASSLVYPNVKASSDN